MSFQILNEPTAARGSVILLHGLNVSPRALGPIAESLSESGFCSAYVELLGHGGAGVERTQVSGSRWMEDLRESLLLARSLPRPLSLLGYSLGGLLSARVLVDRTEPLVDRLVLLAPAIGLRPWVQLARPLAYLVPAALPLTSGVPLRYRAATWVSSSWYRALFELHAELLSAAPSEAFRLLPIRTYISSGDEFISAERTASWAKFGNLARYEQFPLKSQARHLFTPQHLVLDQSCLGAAGWSDFTKSLAEFCA